MLYNSIKLTRQLVSAFIDNQRAATVTLTGILAASLYKASAEHDIGNFVFVTRRTTLAVGDNGYNGLLQIIRGDATLLDQTPTGNNGLWETRIYSIFVYFYVILKLIFIFSYSHLSYRSCDWHWANKLDARCC